jgi:hypothetical protein
MEINLMDKTMQDYRKRQFDHIKRGEKDTFPIKIKFHKPPEKVMDIGRETHWLDITNEEFEAIKTLLTGE